MSPFVSLPVTVSDVSPGVRPSSRLVVDVVWGGPGCVELTCVRRRRSLPLRRLSHPHSSTICQRSRGQDLVMVTDPVYIAGDCLNVWLARNTLQRLSGVARGGGAVGAAAPSPEP